MKEQWNKERTFWVPVMVQEDGSGTVVITVWSCASLSKSAAWDRWLEGYRSLLEAFYPQHKGKPRAAMIAAAKRINGVRLVEATCRINDLAMIQ